MRWTKTIIFIFQCQGTGFKNWFDIPITETYNIHNWSNTNKILDHFERWLKSSLQYIRTFLTWKRPDEELKREFNENFLRRIDFIKCYQNCLPTYSACYSVINIETAFCFMKSTTGNGRTWRGARRRNEFRKQSDITLIFRILYQSRRSWNIEVIANIETSHGTQYQTGSETHQFVDGLFFA